MKRGYLGEEEGDYKACGVEHCEGEDANLGEEPVDGPHVVASSFSIFAQRERGSEEIPLCSALALFSFDAACS